MGFLKGAGRMMIVAMVLGACTSDAGEPAPTGPTANEQVILDFIEAWSRLDPAELGTFFTEDGVYHNMPAQPVQGRAQIEGFIGGFSASWTETTWEVLNIMSAGDVVIAERVDHTKAGEKAVDLPVVGVFEMENGKIKVWRDYFDLATYTRGMS